MTLDDGEKTPGDLMQPETEKTYNIYTRILDKAGQAKIIIVELGRGKSGQVTNDQALEIARSAIHDSREINRVIFIRDGKIIVDESR